MDLASRTIVLDGEQEIGYDYMVGGGATGVETAGALGRTHITLFEQSPFLLAPSIHIYANTHADHWKNAAWTCGSTRRSRKYARTE
jgi:NADH dehydrogenase FAD-containing subunit